MMQMIAKNKMQRNLNLWRSWQVDLNRLGTSVLVGMAVGLIVIGGGMRLAMRMVVLVVGLTPSFSISGTGAILLIGLTVGMIWGLLYAPLARWVPSHWVVKGMLLGLPFSTLIAAAFLGLFGPLEGEAALAGPWSGVGLFAPLPLIFSLILAYLVNRLELRIAAAFPRRINLMGLILYLALLAWAFANMMALADSVRTPPGLRLWLESGGVAFHEVRDVQSMMGLLFVLLFCGLHMVLFWVGSQQRSTLITSVGQLLLASLLIRPEPLLPWLDSVDAGSLAEWLAWGVVAFLGCGWIWWAQEWRSVRGAVALFIISFLLMWLTVLMMPSLQLSGLTAIQIALSVSPFLWPWLLLPLCLLWLKFNCFPFTNVSFAQSEHQ